MTLSIDRFEGKYAICTGDNTRTYALETKNLPAGAKEGGVLQVTETGDLVIDPQETANRRAAVNKIQNKVFKKGGGK